MKRKFNASEFFKQRRVPKQVPKVADKSVRHAFEHLDMRTVEVDTIFLLANAGGGKTHSLIQFLKNHSDSTILVVSHTNAAVNVVKTRLKSAMATKHIPPNIDVLTFDAVSCRNARQILAGQNGKNFNCDGSGWRTDAAVRYTKENNITFIDYLKSKPTINTTYTINRLIMNEQYVWKKYDILLVDEAQDLCPIAEKFLNQSTAIASHKIFIGDPKQSIYYTSCVFHNALINTKKFHFTHTFRYDGTAIIDYLNTYVHGESRHTSSMTRETLLQQNVTFSQFARTHDQCTVLVTAWKELHKYDCENMYIDPSAKRKIRSYIKHYRTHRKEYEKWLGLYGGSIVAFREYLKNQQMGYLIDFDTPKWLDIEQMLDKNDENRPDKDTAHHITTVHQMKGMECKNVYVDNSCVPDLNKSPASVRIKENLFYVAVTRATDAVGMKSTYSPYKFTNWLSNVRQYPDWGELEEGLFADRMYEKTKQKIMSRYGCNEGYVHLIRDSRDEFY